MPQTLIQSLQEFVIPTNNTNSTTLAQLCIFVLSLFCRFHLHYHMYALMQTEQITITEAAASGATVLKGSM